ncbi:hypothetical protein Clacol_004352 [Clathrus columnatus]|uniref:Uncharacterized protein n=1 Tax=Clathrus columnatus TaxID=1419009 RepID=A0AAV5A664_9AGAM|nr:hypothetical protein Clacol_004352 [Clathrus columnatus]
MTNAENQTVTADLLTLFLVNNVAIILSDLLAFLAVIRQVWGLWKEKRELRLHTDNDFVTLLLQQVGTDIAAFQNVLSTILICEFTLDLRRRNTAQSLPNQSALELSDLNLSSQHNPVRSIRSVLGRLQESIIAVMGERNDPVGVDDTGPDEEEPN